MDLKTPLPQQKHDKHSRTRLKHKLHDADPRRRLSISSRPLISPSSSGQRYPISTVKPNMELTSVACKERTIPTPYIRGEGTLLCSILCTRSCLESTFKVITSVLTRAFLVGLRKLTTAKTKREVRHVLSFVDPPPLLRTDMAVEIIRMAGR
jgi:hypothetical protein